MKPAIRRISQSLAALYSLTGLLGFAKVAQAQVTPEQGGGTTVNQEGNKFQIEDGVEAGNNQIFSFDQFSLGSEQEAIFNVNANIQNILSRITGGSPSEINGLIDVLGGTGSTNLFLMNPAGIIFGQGASLNVPGDFTATTATSIGLGNDQWFNATGPIDASQLGGNPNNSFAFNTSEPGSIINLANLTVNDGNLTLLGGTVVSEGTLSAPNGQITVATVPGDSVVRLSQPGMVLNLEVPAYTGATPLPLTELAQLLTGGDLGNATQITVNNGQVELQGSGLRVENGVAVVNQGDVVLSGNVTASTGININANNGITTANLNTSNSGNQSQGNAGSISLSAQENIVTGTVNTEDNSQGNSGSVTAATTQGSIDIESISTKDQSFGDAGDVLLSAQENITTGQITTENQGKGSAGDVTISSRNGDISVTDIFATNQAPQSDQGAGSIVTLSTETGAVKINQAIRVRNQSGGTQGEVNWYAPEGFTYKNIDPSGVVTELDEPFNPSIPASVEIGDATPVSSNNDGNNNNDNDNESGDSGDSVVNNGDSDDNNTETDGSDTNSGDSSDSNSDIANQDGDGVDMDGIGNDLNSDSSDESDDDIPDALDKDDSLLETEDNQTADAEDTDPSETETGGEIADADTDTSETET
ncbi:MAG: filamentous hemagglutinin N-terminal domain-containing protein, partial [Coleofasciculus sp.]|uniref:two-partner secretion domain-containing protein n=1 Tax=Coleofasciculus sp. TaxID=3100458 RepID=UPI003A1FB899